MEPLPPERAERAPAPTGSASRWRGDFRWRTSSYSGSIECVEVAPDDGVVLMRNSRRPDDVTIAHSAPAWRSFLGAVRAGALDRPTSHLPR